MKDTLHCKKCNVTWEATGNYNYDLGGWNYGDGEFCPNGCKNILGLTILGTSLKEIKRKS